MQLLLIGALYRLYMYTTCLQGYFQMPVGCNIRCNIRGYAGWRDFLLSQVFIVYTEPHNQRCITQKPWNIHVQCSHYPPPPPKPPCQTQPKWVESEGVGYIKLAPVAVHVQPLTGVVRTAISCTCSQLSTMGIHFNQPHNGFGNSRICTY